jgi:transcriptional regulator with XRE-family HTH domain
LGDHLRRRRLERGLQQSEVAGILGVHFNTVATWELNQKSPVARHVPKIHEFLGCCPWAPAEFPERLRRAREALGLGQRELAARLGTSQEVVRGWERARYRPSRRLWARIGVVAGLVT